jgi:hypothetical protein
MAQRRYKKNSRKAPTSEQREKTGIKSGPNKGKYPLATKAQALSAIKLRHNGKGVSSSSVLSRVARSKWGKDPQVKAALERARKVDAKK